MKCFFKVFLIIVLLKGSLEVEDDYEDYVDLTDAKLIQPYFNARQDVVFMVHNHQNPQIGSQIAISDVTTLRTSTYNPALETRVLIHGFRNDGESSFNWRLRDAYLNHSNVNVIVVDWGLGSGTINYPAARGRVNGIGILVAEFLDFLNEVGSMDYNKLILCGYSLGAHIAGIAGKHVGRGRVGAIIALDPAGPLFDMNKPGERLDQHDAIFVAAIHTNGGRLGFGRAIGHADFFPNGGSSQPGCNSINCSHRRSVLLFEESLVRGPLPACPEGSRNCLMDRVFMGANFLNRTIRGRFNLITQDRPPFGIIF